MKYVLLHTPTWQPGPLASVLEGAQVQRREVRLLRDVAADDRPTVLLLDPDNRSLIPLDALRALVDAGGAIVALGRPGETEVPQEMPAELRSSRPR